jgi:hypothetical protein
LEAETEKKMEEGRWKMEEEDRREIREERKGERHYRCACGRLLDVPPALM